MRVLRTVAFATLALLVVVVLVLAWAGREVDPGPFYSAPVPALAQPGALLGRETHAPGVPAGARAWRIRYATTNSRGETVAATALVLAGTAPASGPRPVVAWAHGTTGVSPACAPSLAPDPFRVPGLAALIAAGWVYVGTDYAGLGTPGMHEYLVGAGEARSVLDAIRAARRLREVEFAPRAVVWGHSQGGHAALWSGILAREYAPDAGVVGVAAIAPATDLPELTAAVQHSVVGRILNSYLLAAYDAAYADVDFDAWTAGLRRTLARRMTRGCLEGRTALPTLAAAIAAGGSIFVADPRAGTLGQRLEQNSPALPIAAPVLIAQGAKDELVRPEIQARFVADRCAAGQVLEYAEYDDRDHLSVVAADSPLVDDLLDWTRARFAGRPGPSACRGVATPGAPR